MNKSTLILAIIYLILIVYFAIFNWNVFVLELDINLGVKIIQAPLIAVIFFAGFLLFILQWLNSSFSNLLVKKKLTKAKNEINTLKVYKELRISDKLDFITKKVEEISLKMNSQQQNAEVKID